MDGTEELIRKITELLRGADRRSLEIVLAFVRALTKK